jgi:hypothetical protein
LRNSVRYDTTITLRFNLTAFVISILLFIVLVLLATLGARLGWIRGFVGDVVAVMWVYCVFCAMIETRAEIVAGAAFAIGCLVELTQYFMARFDIQIPSRALTIVLGSTPDWWDIFAYALGAFLVLSLAILQRSRILTKRLTTFGPF